MCRRIAADALKGIRTAEELEDDAAVSDAPNGTRTVQRAPARKAVEAVKAPTEPTPTDPTQAAARVVSAPYADPPAEDVNLPPLPGEESSGPVRDQSADAVTDAQLRKLGAVFTSLGVKGTGEREQRLRAASRVVGRELTTSKDLTKDEARLLIDTLEAADAEHVAYLLDDHVETAPEVEATQPPLPDDDEDGHVDEIEGEDDT